jgi:hypothetical protein
MYVNTGFCLNCTFPRVLKRGRGLLVQAIGSRVRIASFCRRCWQINVSERVHHNVTITQRKLCDYNNSEIQYTEPNIYYHGGVMHLSDPSPIFLHFVRVMVSHLTGGICYSAIDT